MNEKEAVAKAIAQTGALQFGLFKDGRGKPIPYYLDLTKLWSEPTWLRLACDMMQDVIRRDANLIFDRIGGADFTGLPLATGMAQRLNMPLIVLRRKDHIGKQELPVIGNLFPGERILVVDDVIATGSKAMEIAHQVRTEGGLLSAYLVLLDKEQGGSNLLKSENMKLITILSISEVADILFRMGWLDDQQFSALSSSVSRSSKT